MFEAQYGYIAFFLALGIVLLLARLVICYRGLAAGVGASGALLVAIGLEVYIEGQMSGKSFIYPAWAQWSIVIGVVMFIVAFILLRSGFVIRLKGKRRETHDNSEIPSGLNGDTVPFYKEYVRASLSQDRATEEVKEVKSLLEQVKRELLAESRKPTGEQITKRRERLEGIEVAVRNWLEDASEVREKAKKAFEEAEDELQTALAKTGTIVS